MEAAMAEKLALAARKTAEAAEAAVAEGAAAEQLHCLRQQGQQEQYVSRHGHALSGATALTEFRREHA